MIKFLEENGYPMTVIVDTEEIEEKNGLTEEEKEDGLTELGKQAAIAFGYRPQTTYKSTFSDAAGNILTSFNHNDMRARIHWVDGFFTALKLKKSI